MSEDAIVLTTPSMVRGSRYSIGWVFYPDKTIGRQEAQALVEAEKARRVRAAEQPRIVGGYLDVKA